MQRMFFELSNTSRQLDYLISTSIERSDRKGDRWDAICDDVTDAREKIIAAMKTASRAKGQK